MYSMAFPCLSTTASSSRCRDPTAPGSDYSKRSRPSRPIASPRWGKQRRSVGDTHSSPHATGTSRSREAELASLRHFEELGDDWYAALAQSLLAWTAFGRGGLSDAMHWIIVALDSYYALGDIASMTLGLGGVEIIIRDSGMAEEAATIHGGLRGALPAICRPPACGGVLGPAASRLPTAPGDQS
jgi:hypothetical protein